MSLIEGKEISHTFTGCTEPVLKMINFSIQKGKITVLLGVSGSGKTTLLKCIACLLQEESGAITYGGTLKMDLSTKERIEKIGYVSQHYELFPHLSVLQNCIHPQQKVLKRSKEEAKLVTEKLLLDLSLTHLKDRLPKELSGGQKQRVAIARALGMGSQVLLLDEPTSALDPESTKKLTQILLGLKQRGYTLVITTHDMPFAESVMDHVYFMEEGKICTTESKINTYMENTK